MGHVTAKAIVKGPAQELEIEFLVDTGAFYTILTPAMWRLLGIEIQATEPARMADNRSLEMPIGIARIAINGRGTTVLVGQIDTPMPYLGVSALEALGLKVNPIEGTLEPARPFPEVLQ